MGELPRLRVLLVEDEGGVALLLEDMLEQLDCEVVASAARLVRAREALGVAGLNFAILDMNVAGESSFELARTLADHRVPFLFSTGYGNTGLPEDLTDRVVLTKPFTLADLRRAIGAALERSG